MTASYGPHALTAGADHRFDELVIRDLVSPAHQLADALRAIGSIVEAACAVERTDRVVDGLNDKELRTARGRSGHVLHHRGFRGLQVFPNPAAPFHLRPDKTMRF